ncbi:TetR/AcrR family transcriptional regulator [Nocardiopsis tropica]|uniref:TetR/AcrR family transcriptional regulator n=1 Tax=Nocardiopsis tropica TaxID=109330 RepID=A0ABU7KK47_9ACTN|nr:TetR/AcrR family transcriptional regulator [Nocardiopsis umidischolae]MEE2049648.1 TetR/AcrR family transcriptional regulator [Nocardiopsis umidischolae]
MTTDTDTARPSRVPLSRARVLEAALHHVDEHGLEALSMHKLGDRLGVKGMSLYKHVVNKDDVLDGIVDLLWAEIPDEPGTGDWREAVRTLARSLRALVHRHPRAAPLLTSRPTLTEGLLRGCDTLLRMMRADGVPEACAVALLRTVYTHGMGFALAELSWARAELDGIGDEVGRTRRVASLLPPDASDDLVRTALLVCGDCDMDDQFEIGLDLMLRGLDSYLEAGTGRACGVDTVSTSGS